MTHPRLQRTLHHLEKLVALDSRNPPRAVTADGPLLGYLKASLPKGMAVTVADHGQGCVSLLAVRGQPRFLFNAHVDTVPADPAWKTDPLVMQVTDTHAVGLGVADTKGAAAALLTALEETTGDAAVLFTSDEEAGNSTCVTRFLETRPGFSGVVVAEPTQARAALVHRGILSFSAECTGVGGHASSPRALTDSAVHDLMRWGERALSAVRVWDRVEFRGLSGVRFNIGTVEGGTKPNMIAAHARARCSLRSHPGVAEDDILDAFRRLAPNAERFTIMPGFRAPTLPATGQLPADALAAALGLEVGPAVDFWTEAALFSAAGIPALVFGAGDIAQAHTAGEFVLLSQLLDVANAYARILGGKAVE